MEHEVGRIGLPVLNANVDGLAAVGTCRPIRPSVWSAAGMPNASHAQTG